MIFGHTNYRDFLKTTLSERITKNPSYSLRAFALSLEMSPSLLSEVMAGKKNVSPDRAVKIAKKLSLKSKESEYFLLLVQFESSKEIEVKNQIFEKMKLINNKRQVTDVNMDTFRLISDWYHIPILVMTDTKLKFDAATISKKLGITVVESEAALERLYRLGLLSKKEDGTVQQVHQDAVFRSEASNRGLQYFHRKMMELAQIALITQDNSQKYVGSETLAVDKSDLAQAREIIDECFDKVVKVFNGGKNRTEIYHLGIQLFSLIKNEKINSD